MSYIQESMVTFGIGKLFEQTGISRSHLYGIQKGAIDPQLSTLLKIINCLGLDLKIIQRKEKTDLDLKDENYFLWSLASFGAPISCEKSFTHRPDLNELLIEALERGRRNAKVNVVFPLFIQKNKMKFDWDFILQNTSQKVYLGYLLNLVDRFRNDPLIAGIYSKIYAQASLKTSLLITGKRPGKFQKKILDKVDNEIAKTWKIKTFDTLEECHQRFEKWL